MEAFHCCIVPSLQCLFARAQCQLIHCCCNSMHVHFPHFNEILCTYNNFDPNYVCYTMPQYPEYFYYSHNSMLDIDQLDSFLHRSHTNLMLLIWTRLIGSVVLNASLYMVDWKRFYIILCIFIYTYLIFIVRYNEIYWVIYLYACISMCMYI